MSGFIKEFKDFAMKGNLVDMAVGIIIGGAFGKIVSSLVGDVIMPIIGKLTGGIDFKDLFINLSDEAYSSLAEAVAASAPVIKYGLFIQTVFDFVVVALSIFVVIKWMNSLKKKEEAAAPAAPAEDILLLREIRDNLKK